MLTEPLSAGEAGHLMIPRLQARYDELEQRRSDLLVELSGLDGSQLAFRPSSEAWSVLQVAQHLLLVEEAILAQRPEQELCRRNPRQRVGHLLVSLVLKTGLRVRVPTRRVVPEPVVDLGETAERWERARDGLRARLEELTVQTARNVFARHPIAGPLDAAESLLFLTRHFDHHLGQVRRIRSAPGFPDRG